MSYKPDDDAKPLGKLFTRQLSQRDLALSIPINFVETAGVSLTRACFADRRYVAESAQRCFSNLLAIGFHRYEVDIYWDVGRQLWSLCPVEVGADAAPLSVLAPTDASLTSTSASIPETQLSMVAMSSDAALATRDDVAAQRRQATATDTQLDQIGLPSASTIATSVSADDISRLASSSVITTSTSVPSPGQLTNGSDYQTIGPYACSASANLDWLSRIMWTFLDETQTNLNSSLKYLVLNVHAAASPSDPLGSAPNLSSDELPESDALLSNVLVANLSSFLYTPSNLQEQRANINASWFDVPEGTDSGWGYYRIEGRQDATYTDDGWPSQHYVEMEEGKRLLVGFGSVDPQMDGYDVSQDESIIFPQDYIQDIERIAMTASGQVTEGCFYAPGVYSIDQENNNNTWAVAVNPSDTTNNLLTSSSNITRCGVSPILNSTLLNATADRNFVPYQTFLQSTIWSWAPGYPRLELDEQDLPSNSSSNSGDDSDDDSISHQPRCAALNATSGFWQNVMCDNAHHSACRKPGAIYDWSISSDDTTYTKAGISCRDDSLFDVPRTGLQNTYLLNTWRAYISNPSTDIEDTSDEMLWLNFNNLDSPLCWVVGQNSTCPYVNRRSDSRQVIVPVVAAVVVFALGVMTIFVKCAANRQMNKQQKRRRRGDDGWDYEGVPS